jgi:hypothetical protein
MQVKVQVQRSTIEVQMYILKCEAFDDERSARYSNVCCKGDCHETKTFINVTPYTADSTLENRKVDWSLGIQGYVCCGRYEFVRSLSREWWVRRLAVIDNWSEEKVRTYLTQGSWHRVYDRGTTTGGRPAQSKARQTKVQHCPQCGSNWNEVACDDCGYSG